MSVVRVVQAELVDFRNFAKASIEPSEDISALVGPNGQGKTNAVEALYLLAALRPLRQVTRKSLIREGQPQALLSAKVHHNRTGLFHELQLKLSGASRRLMKDGKEVPALEFLGNLVAISFTPDDLQLAKGGPDGRRRFLDRALLNARPTYLTRALRYAKVVKDRNRLLVKQASDAELDAFDVVLAEEGARITAARRTYVHQIATKLSTRFRDIASPAPDLSVRYSSKLEAEDTELPAALLQALGDARAKDRARGSTSVGPHRDDLIFELDGIPVRERASQGQHRALILALKLVELEELSSALDEAPILLLDDMSSELDDNRTRQLFECVRQLEGQVILTSTSNPDRLCAVLQSDRKIVVQEVENGCLSSPRFLAGSRSPTDSGADQSSETP